MGRAPLHVWVFRALWVGVVFAIAPAIDDALRGRSHAVRLVAEAGAWTAWALVLLAALVPTTVSLTVVRSAAPLAAVVATIAWVAGASAVAGAVGVAAAGVAVAVAFSGELGEAFVQGSAYGEEHRYPLRPPGPLVLVVPFAWALGAAAVVAGPLLLAARVWWLGAPTAVLAAALVGPLGRRFHRLSRRWLVLVPAGVVVHDQMVLAETAMLARADVASASLALVGTEAADLTGQALGPAVELRLREPATVVLTTRPRGTTRALHVRSLLVSPTRPGRVVHALRDAGLPPN